MVAISGNVIGTDFADVFTAAEAASGIKPIPFKTGQTVIGDDGGLYQYAKAGEAIAADNTAALITLTDGEYVAAASGGSAANASATVLAAGDYAWFKIS